ncbi:MAG TPA: dephospho-CoA kinase [Bacteroidia bacterium]|nr:dephospho-CoA kinase [Bacteroidia bacterium]
MLKVGITGGIGSGKTTVCKVFELLGVPVYYADDASRELLETDTDIKNEIVAVFGKEVIDENDRIIRKKVASLVFGNEQQLKKLNAIIHPAVALHFENWLTKHATAPYILKEAAILFESGAYLQMDKVIAVSAPEELRIARVVKRDKVLAEEVKRRMQNQLPEEERIKRSHYVITNDEEQLVIPQVIKLHKEILDSQHL